MNKFIKRFTTLAATSLLLIGVSLISFGGTAKAIPWTPGATGLDHPGFNVFTGVPDVGNEADFIRGRVSGSTNEFTDPVNDACAAGTQYSVRVYVHNGANQSLNDNGNGPGVAHNTRVSLSVPVTTASKISGKITADNASTVTDTLTINCNGKTMQLSYVNASAVQQCMDGTVTPLSDNIVTNGGVQIGCHSVKGDVWGCFEQRVLVYLKVQVKELPPPPQSLVCDSLNVTVVDNQNRRVHAKITGTAHNTTISGYSIHWGENNASDNVQEADHTYSGNGPFTIQGFVIGKVNGTTKIVSNPVNCVKNVSFAPGVPPVTPPPTTLVNTGAGDVIGIFFATALGAALWHRFYFLRRFQR